MCLHVFVSSFKRQNDVTPSNAMTDAILQWDLTTASARIPDALKTDFVVSYNMIFYTPHNLCLWWVYCFHVVRTSVRNILFP